MHHRRHRAAAATIPLPSFAAAGTVKPRHRYCTIIIVIPSHRCRHGSPLLPVGRYRSRACRGCIPSISVAVGPPTAPPRSPSASFAKAAIAAATTHPTPVAITPHHSLSPPGGRYCSRDTSGVYCINIGGCRSTVGATEPIVHIVSPGGNCSSCCNIAPTLLQYRNTPNPHNTHIKYIQQSTRGEWTW